MTQASQPGGLEKEELKELPFEVRLFGFVESYKSVQTSVLTTTYNMKFYRGIGARIHIPFVEVVGDFDPFEAALGDNANYELIIRKVEK